MPTLFTADTPPTATGEAHGVPRPSTHRYLHAFCLWPKTRFEGQHQDEEVILLLRAHPITQIPWIFVVFVLAMTPVVFTLFLKDFISTLQLIYVYLVWYVFLGSYIYVNVINYVFNVGIVTNQRVVDVDYHNVLYKEINASTLDKIEDVTTKTGGFIRSLLHFGDIYVQTAGAVANIEFGGIPEPTEAARIINELMHKHPHR